MISAMIRKHEEGLNFSRHFLTFHDSCAKQRQTLLGVLDPLFVCQADLRKEVQRELAPNQVSESPQLDFSGLQSFSTLLT